MEVTFKKKKNIDSELFKTVNEESGSHSSSLLPYIYLYIKIYFNLIIWIIFLTLIFYQNFVFYVNIFFYQFLPSVWILI